MKRKDFLKKGVWGFATVLTGAAIAGGKENNVPGDDCDVSPRETKGPFPTRTPAQMVQSNIKSDRDGIALLINFTILDKANKCKPLAGAYVDIWHCDKDGNYSEYGNHPMQRTDLTSAHFLRGRQ
ncbi:MAG TPA: intradiol ring-cleavage dioxygenase, partial [Chitinophagaceae bacterium]|nr:intradiol ring-cleavage dioxygenase [Chitinophagaceae bacterium]